jgi:hypothetical protein
MDRALTDLVEIVQREVEAYAEGDVWQGFSYSVSDISRNAFAVLMILNAERAFKPLIEVAARVVGDKVIIDADNTDRPLFEAFMEAGIPRDQIVRLYAGERE